MKIGFVCSERYSEYNDLIREILDNINEQLIKDGQTVESSKVLIGTRKKYDLYIFITDDIDDFKLNYSKIKPKNKPVLITQNLDENYIKTVITFVTDIIYSKSNVEIIVNRIVNIIEGNNA